MTRIYIAADLPDAHLVLHLLAQAGITAHVFNENAQGGVGEIPFTHAYPEVWIADEGQVARARQIVKGHDRAQADVGVVFCRNCAEENPGNFQICWNCGAAL
ncbi:MAG: DUF2007 domain-containing protein [Betaproteobacteria bacterium]|nr:DUF2007 domain-containing protein [Betaproteobacteria bacterium]